MKNFDKLTDLTSLESLEIIGGGDKSAAAGAAVGGFLGTLVGTATACAEKINEFVIEYTISKGLERMFNL